MTELATIQPARSFKILLLGDSCTDEYYIGTCDRLNPEAPVPIMNIREHYTTPGMASNVYKNLTTLGCEVDFITNAETITKTRYIDKKSGQHLLRVDNDRELTSWSGRTTLPLETYDAIVMSDYNKGFLTYSEMQHVCRSFDGPIFIDTKKTDLRRFNPAFIKINELEYSKRTSEASNMIITLGGRGAMYKKDFLTAVYDGYPAEIVDVCGCGDTFLSALTYQYLMTKDIDSAIIFANAAASITVQHRGNYAPTLDEINARH